MGPRHVPILEPRGKLTDREKSLVPYPRILGYSVVPRSIPIAIDCA